MPTQKPDGGQGSRAQQASPLRAVLAAHRGKGPKEVVMGRGGASAHYATQKATTSINELKTSKATKAAGKVSLAPPLKIK